MEFKLNSTSIGYWGEPSSTIDWCEDNYALSFYIAEFWNTISNVLFVVLAIYGYRRARREGFEPRFLYQYIAVIIVGIGSASFHGTLRYVEQQCDETPMIWTVLIWNYIIYQTDIERYNPKLNKMMPYLLALFGIGFAVLHAIYRFTLGFQLFFGAWCIIALIRLRKHQAATKSKRAKKLAESYVKTGLIGMAFWLCDYHLCNHIKSFPINPQGHAWWHLFMGLNSYYGPLFMQYVRADELKWNPSVETHGLGLLPTVVVKVRKD